MQILTEEGDARKGQLLIDVDAASLSQGHAGAVNFLHIEDSEPEHDHEVQK